MSLCGPAVATRSTARPPGTKKGSPNAKERPMDERLEYATPMGSPILKNMSGAFATNGRCTNEEEMQIHGMLERFLTEVEQQEYQEASPSPMDWRKIYGDASTEPWAQWQAKHANDAPHKAAWDDQGEDDSLFLSQSSSLWDDENDEDSLQEECWRKDKEPGVPNKSNESQQHGLARGRADRRKFIVRH